MGKDKKDKKFVHLHVHTEYSLLDGVNRITSLLDKVQELGMSSIAMTDHGVMYGLYDFWNQARERGIKPIIGVEAYLAPDKRTLRQEKDGIKYFHLVLLAKNYEGYKNLLKLVSRAHLEGFYYRPRIDRELLEKYHEGLICTTACLAGPLSTYILRNEKEKAKDWLKFLKSIFDKDFYIELQRFGPDGTDDIPQNWYEGRSIHEVDQVKKQAKVNKELIRLARENDVPLTVSTDAHYLIREDKEIQEVLFAIKDGVTLNNPNRRRGYPETFIKSPEEMWSLFSDLPEALENTVRIADSVEEFDITYDRIQPEFKKLPEKYTPREYLKKLAYEGVKNRYGKLSKDLKERVDYELSIIHDKGYDDYFLVVWDYIKYARSNDILVGPGRGSGAGSVVAYALNITDIDPIRWELYFERFLNPERESPPDFDIDFQDDRRDELFRYMERTYGKEQTANICTFGRMKTRAAIRDVSRVMGIDLNIADKLSKRVEVKFGRVTPIKTMIEKDAEFRKVIESGESLKKMVEIVSKIEGMARHISTHACGFLVTPEPITNYLPIQRDSKNTGTVITQVEGYPLEPMGLMKFDFLGLSNLTIIKNVIHAISDSRSIDIDISNIPLDDKITYELFQKGETTAVFQFESDGMKKYLRDLHPEEFEDLIFLAAAYRPGPMKYIPSYIKRKHGKEKTEYLHKDLEPILKNTYGYAIYQEQVIRIAVDIAGYTMGEADMLRRAMGKKKPEVMAKEKEKFIKGCLRKGYSKKTAEKIFEYLEPFADYGFNKAHSACYSLIAYWTAYLKAHYPVEFMVGLLESDLNNTDKILRDIHECERLGIEILPPDINLSGERFTIAGDKKIRYGLMGLKNVSHSAVSALVEERDKNGEFKNLDDICYRVDLDKLNKKTLEILIKVGSMDKFGNRNALLTVLPVIYEKAQKERRIRAHGQTGLFEEGMGQKNNRAYQTTKLPDVHDIDESKKLEWERELIGVYVSAHPIDKYKEVFEMYEISSIADIKNLDESKNVEVGGLLSNIKIINTKGGNKRMAFGILEDRYDRMDIVIFPNKLEEYEDMLSEITPIVIKGTISKRGGSQSIILEELKPVDSFSGNLPNIAETVAWLDGYSVIKIKVPRGEKSSRLKALKQTLINNPGDKEVLLEVPNGNGRYKVLKLQSGLRITPEVAQIIMPYVQTN